jgi:prepilin-type N-terminal cleavage/methylation domain-containing protein
MDDVGMNARRDTVSRQRPEGFTLIELLVVLGIIGMLAGLFFPSLVKAKSRAARIHEVHAARQVLLAWQMYAGDHGSRVLPGYRYGFEARDVTGNLIAHPTNARYPWRLAPYLGNQFEALYINKNRALLHNFKRQGNAQYTYAASVFPSLGINSIFVGGDDLVLPPGPAAYGRFGAFCVLKITDVSSPSDLIVFASAQSQFNGDRVEGYYRVEPPSIARRIWPSPLTLTLTPTLAPEQTGFVHPRYEGGTVVGMTDGHAAVLSLEAIQDMRHWANTADRPDWVLKPIQ